MIKVILIFALCATLKGQYFAFVLIAIIAYLFRERCTSAIISLTDHNMLRYETIIVYLTFYLYCQTNQIIFSFWKQVKKVFIFILRVIN